MRKTFTQEEVNHCFLTVTIYPEFSTISEDGNHQVLTQKGVEYLEEKLGLFIREKSIIRSEFSTIWRHAREHASDYIKPVKE